MQIANALKTIGKERIDVATPAYFTTFNQAQIVGLATSSLETKRTSTGYSIASLEPNGQVLWLTNPIYSTGVRLNQAEFDDLARRCSKDGTILVVDESLAPLDCQLSKASEYPAIFILSPHKTILTNAGKFSLVCGPVDLIDIIELQADYFFGGIPLSTWYAASHAASSNFREATAFVRHQVRRTWKDILPLLRRYRHLEIDLTARGHFRTIYFPSIPAKYGYDPDFMWKLLRASATYVIPGVFDFFSNNAGFCFRVNLGRDSAQFRVSLARLLAFLEHLA